VRRIRDFASRDLALPDNGSYRRYADIGRPYVVWNVFAAPEFSVEPEKWCMLFVGCVSYRGYYDRGQAEQLAREMQARGLDTYVGGVRAYSTLGYFDDPVLNTFLRAGSVEVARLIFHELAHQVVFAGGDSTFNESFAATVENEGLRRWLARYGTAAQVSALAARNRRKEIFIDLVNTYRGKLRDLYALDSSAEHKRQAKAELMAEMKRVYDDIRAGEGTLPDYDKWFAPDLNNAKIASLALYTQLVPAFTALLAQENHDLPRFYRRVAAIAKLPLAARHAALSGVKPSPSAAENRP